MKDATQRPMLTRRYGGRCDVEAPARRVRWCRAVAVADGMRGRPRDSGSFAHITGTVSSPGTPPTTNIDSQP